MGCLYRLISPSGKSYIGITSKSFENRWRQHRLNASKRTKHGQECRALYNAIRKYGPTSFVCTVLTEEADWSKLCLLEQEAIVKYASRWPSGYNLTSGGDGALGACPSIKARKRMSAAQRKILLDPTNHAQRLRNLCKAAEKAAEVHRAMTPEERKLHGERVQSAHRNPLTQSRHRAGIARRWANPAERARQSKALTGRKLPSWTPERKAVAAEKRRREWADPEMRAKRLAGFARYQESRK